MTGLRFPEMEDWDSFMGEFEFSIGKNEFRRPGEEVFRFDLVRQIFLDRGL
jgi:hypothetical protein